MRLSENGKELLAYLEGCELEAYEDVGGRLTIGVGHLLTDRENKTGFLLIDDERIDWVDGIRYEAALKILGDDVRSAELAVERYVVARLAQHQFDVLVSFAFNVGNYAFKNSTLVKELNKGKHHRIPAELERWVHVQKKVSQGLMKRRTAEVFIWSNGYEISEVEITNEEINGNDVDDTPIRESVD